VDRWLPAQLAGSFTPKLMGCHPSQAWEPDAGIRKEIFGMIVEPIGVVKSPVTQTIDENWSHVLSEIHLAPNLAPGLTGIDQFHYIIVVFHMHKASFDPKRDLIRRPQGRPDMPELGIFAQRAKHRPNPIGMTAVQLTKVDANVLTVRGLDAVDGTPILDIKPYYPAFDRIEVPRSPEWVGRLMEKYF